MSNNQNLLAGPLCTQLFAEFGVEVIKIECAASGREDLVNGERRHSDRKRVAIGGEVMERIATWVAGFARRAAATAHLEAHGAPTAAVPDVGETIEHPHFKTRGTVRTIHHQLAGEFAVPGNPTKFVGRNAAEAAAATLNKNRL
jgi:crotonobetainyl-CoA:carnitine CoA-transferase CaiB-like acyl-CoA transferase